MVSLLGMLARPGDVKVVAALAREFLRCGRQWYYSPQGGKCPDNLISALTKVVGPPNPSMLGLLDRDATQQNLVQLKNLIQEMLAGMHIYEEPPKHGPKDGSYMYRNYRETPGELWELCDKLGCNLSSLEERMRSELRQWAEKTINDPTTPLHPDIRPRTMQSGKTLTAYVDVILGAARDLHALRFSSRWIHMVGGEQEQPKNDALDLLKKLKKNFQDSRSQTTPYQPVFDRGLEEINSILLSVDLTNYNNLYVLGAGARTQWHESNYVENMMMQEWANMAFVVDGIGNGRSSLGMAAPFPGDVNGAFPGAWFQIQ